MYINSVMYIKEIIAYLMWPALIFITWVLIKFVLSIYEKSRQESKE